MNMKKIIFTMIALMTFTFSYADTKADKNASRFYIFNIKKAVMKISKLPSLTPVT